MTENQHTPVPVAIMVNGTPYTEAAIRNLLESHQRAEARTTTANKELDRLKAAVTDVVREFAEDDTWTREDANDFLRKVGLDPIKWEYAVTIRATLRFTVEGGEEADADDVRDRIASNINLTADVWPYSFTNFDYEMTEIDVEED